MATLLDDGLVVDLGDVVTVAQHRWGYWGARIQNGAFVEEPVWVHFPDGDAGAKLVRELVAALNKLEPLL